MTQLVLKTAPRELKASTATELIVPDAYSELLVVNAKIRKKHIFLNFRSRFLYVSGFNFTLPPHRRGFGKFLLRLFSLYFFESCPMPLRKFRLDLVPGPPTREEAAGETPAPARAAGISGVPAF